MPSDSRPRTPDRTRVSRPLTHRLYVGVDAEKVIVGRDPLRMRTGRARGHRWGSLVEVVPVRPNGRTRDDRIRSASRLALALVVVSAVSSAAGIAWWLAACVALGVLVASAHAQARAAEVAVLALPRRRVGDPATDRLATDRHPAQVLYAREERHAFVATMTAAKRLQRTWPPLQHLIDVDDAERMLNRALADLAEVLGRRQQLRRLRAELSTADDSSLPPGSQAVAALHVQRARIEQVWRETGQEANRHIRGIEAAAAAGENLIREQQIGLAARDAERALAHLTASAVPAGASTAPELADRTAAVIEAYRELADRYARGV